MKPTVTTCCLFLAATLYGLEADAETYFFHNDHLGTPQAVTDKNQEVVWEAEYDPFGYAIETVAMIDQNLRYPGQYYDRETELHYNYFRTYDPKTGRYLQSDPIGLEGGVSTYTYGLSNSLSYADFYGLDARDVQIIVDDIKIRFPDIKPGPIIYTDDIDPGNEAETTIINGNIELWKYHQNRTLNEQEFEELYYTLLHESMHCTDSSWQRFLDGNFDTNNHEKIANREWWERNWPNNSKYPLPLWGDPVPTLPNPDLNPVELFNNTRVN